MVWRLRGVADVPCGVLMCALTRAEKAKRGDVPCGGRYARRARGMRLYGAWAALRRYRGGEGDMRADGARRDSAGLCGGNIAYREEMLRCGQLSRAGLLLLSTSSALPFLTNC